MADPIYQVVFRIHCTACGQTLDPTVNVEGVTYAHGNAGDCDQPPVTLPSISPDQLAAVFGKSKKPRSATKKVASKKK